MRGSVLILLSAAAVCLVVPRQACAQRRAALAARVGSVRYSDWNDEPWNAGFNSSPGYSTAPKTIATVSPNRSSAGGSAVPQNRINPLTPSSFNAGSVQSVDSPGSSGEITGGTGNRGDNPVWLLVGMGNYLAKQRQLTLWITQTTDRVNASGQKIQTTSKQITYAQWPDRLAVDVTGSDAHTSIVYDGTGVTALETTRNIYGLIPIQGSLEFVLNTLASKYGMAVPADDLLFKGAYSRLEKKIRGAQDLGMETIDGQPCEHAVFTGENVDFQIWIQSGDVPMPRRVEIMYKNAPARPRCTLEITRWDTKPIPASVFKADIPAGARQITIAPRQ